MAYLPLSQITTEAPVDKNHIHSINWKLILLFRLQFRRIIIVFETTV